MLIQPSIDHIFMTVENLLGESKAGSLPVTSSTVSDLHSLSRALLETIHDKNVAINHQRNTNKLVFYHYITYRQ